MSDHPIVDAPCGRLSGLHKGNTSHFHGIPFAQAGRWQAPQPCQPWSGTRAAHEAGPVAPQNPTPIDTLLTELKPVQSEDCLTLSIVRPIQADGPLPVMVWMHGGAFVHGTGSHPLYHATKLAEQGQCLVVTINYRLGTFGFLRIEGVTEGAIGATGNEGLLDQIAALKWVKANIGAFGGDPGNVTIFGESAGAMSVACLLAAPVARGLFHKAILQSGSAHIAHTPEHADRVAWVLAKHLDIPHKDGDRWRGLPAAALLKAQEVLLKEVDDAKDPHKLGSLAFQPAIDGALLGERPIEALRRGCARGVPIICGTTTEEWKLWTALDPRFHAMTEDKLRQWAERMFGDAAEGLLKAEPYGSPYERYIAMQTDRAFREPALRLLAAQTKAGAPVFEYIFDWRSPMLGGAFGACHALEIGFVFGTHDAPRLDQFFGAGPEAARISHAMIAGWSSFARTGAPVIPGADEWRPWAIHDPAAMVFGADARAAHLTRFELDPAWSALGDHRVGP